MSYLAGLRPPGKYGWRDIGFIMPANTVIENLPGAFKAFAEIINAEWPPAGVNTETPLDNHFPGSKVVNDTKILCVRIDAATKAIIKTQINLDWSESEYFTPEDIDQLLVLFQLPWRCAYFASSYPIVDMGEGNQPAIEVLRPMVFEALLVYLEERKDAEGNVIPYTLDDKLSLFAGAENTIRDMCGL
jgi:hypothetical protein